jgi:hypothetical protein
MATVDPLGFGKFVPGFDFLQNLSKQATENIPQLPNLANWIAPTLNVEELDKRLEELKQVQFWLDQNAKALAAVIQALEVQKMTLATLQDMNFNLGDVANAFKLKAADTVMGGVSKAVGAATSAAQAAKQGKNPIKAAASAAIGSGDKSTGAGLVPDPMQWWGSLTKQFADIAGNAMQQASQKTALDAAKNLATEFAKGGMKATEAVTKAALSAASGAGAQKSATAKKVAKNVDNTMGEVKKTVKKAVSSAPKAKKSASATWVPAKTTRQSAFSKARGK